MDTVSSAQKHLDGVKAENQKRISEIQQEIIKRQTEGTVYSANQLPTLEIELEKAKTLAINSEASAQERLKRAQELEAAQEKTSHELIEAANAKIEGKQKATARLAWHRDGGNDADFEKAWPAIREQILTKAAVDGVTKEANRRSITL